MVLFHRESLLDDRNTTHDDILSSALIERTCKAQDIAQLQGPAFFLGRVIIRSDHD